MIKKTLAFIWTYLKDWKNLLAHTVVGLIILSVGLFLPVKPIYRIVLLVVIIILNTIRMKFSDKKAQLKKEAAVVGD
ncbi:MAG: hypothetical protein CL609_02085 [Anaerolineaceae bacterium]|nr:hypothetical protein [Anaerolineaceae bacterium]